MSAAEIAVSDTGESIGRRELLRVLNRGPAGSIVDEVIVAVGTDIIEGRLLPGADLNSVDLARTFGSSRTPVREALLTLQREGFVEISAHRRPRVAPLHIEEVRELYQLRAELYAIVSRAVVEVADDEDLTRLRTLQDELERATDEDDVDRYFWVNVQFRNTEAAIAGNKTLRRVLDSLGLRMLQLRHLSLSLPGRLQTSLEDHARLLRAYEDRDAVLAAALTQSLVLRGLAAIERSGWTGRADADGVPAD
jgi:DNA-binding GntR family transcriptional regulator